MPPKNWIAASDLFIVQPQTPEEVDALMDDLKLLVSLMPNVDDDYFDGIREFPEYLTLIYHQEKPVAFIQIEDSRGYDIGKDSLEFSGSVLPEYRDKGLTQTVSPTVIRQAFKRTGKRKMLAKIHPENTEAQAAIVALGFERVQPHPDLPLPEKVIYKLTRKSALAR